jgi:cation diffusion facilitator CzcD-associated flavoprotein CzcO
MLGTYEYPDFPMATEEFGVKPGEHIPGEIVHKYLSKYAEKFNIIDHIRYNSRVEVAEHQEKGGWILTVREDAGQATNTVVEKKVLVKKLIVATGLTSEPFLPHIEGQESFRAPLFHSKDLQQHVNISPGPGTRATVFGATKSGWDAVYAYATQGIPVDWVIRQSGHGPAWMAPPYVTPLKKWLEKLVHTRLLTWFSPCIWSGAGGYSGIRWFLHGTAIGRALTNAFWSILGNDVITLNKFDSHPEMAKLKPWSSAMFTGTSFSILNYDTDFFELLRSGMVKVHIADIVGLSHRTIHLSSGMTLHSDALCCVTGWKSLPPVKFLPEGIEKDLGIPHTPSPDDPHSLIRKADEEILTRFPRLQDQPTENEHFVPLLDSKGISRTNEAYYSAELTPFSLYRFMIPPTAHLLKHRDIAFAGMLMTFTTTIIAHLQALWINAYFREEVSFPEWTASEAMDNLRYEAVLFNRFGKWRYPSGLGSRQPDFVFDAVPYLDLLAADLGVKVHRKRGWLAEAVEPYGPEDYVGVVAEWTQKHQPS